MLKVVDTPCFQRKMYCFVSCVQPVPTWEGGLHPLRPGSPYCPGGAAPPHATDGASGGGGAVGLRLAGGVASELPALKS